MKLLQAALSCLIVFMLVSCSSVNRQYSSGGKGTPYVRTFSFDKADINNSASYTDTSGGLTLTVTPIFNEVIEADPNEGLKFDTRYVKLPTATELEEKSISMMSAYRLRFSENVKIVSYTVGFSDGNWDEDDASLDVYGNKMSPLPFGINNFHDFTADGPDPMYTVGPNPDTGVTSITHKVCNRGLYGDTFRLYEDGTDFGRFSLKSIEVVAMQE
ncbi:MAG: hypothetical protein HY809_01080 [Nitrospirae bacterium]|nr:hypothetical protein [Nitrospirota bacterium]